MTLRHFVTDEAAAALRSYVALDGRAAPRQIDALDAAGIFAPIEETTAPTARASCRLCGRPIEQGGRVIKFGLDPYRAARGGFGKLSAALIHRDFCVAREEEK